MSLLKPFIKLDEAQCHRCMNPINVYDFEANTVKLSQEGFPLETNNISTKLIGKCPICGAEYEVERNGVYYAITSNLRKEYKGDNQYDEQQLLHNEQRIQTSIELIGKHNPGGNEFGHY